MEILPKYTVWSWSGSFQLTIWQPSKTQNYQKSHSQEVQYAGFCSRF